MKYLVMEIHETYCVLLSEDGQFYHAANLHYQTGQEVFNPVLMKQTEQKESQFHFSLRPAFSLAIAFCLLLVCVNAYSYYQLPYLSFLLTINPSVRIEMSRSGNVIKVTGVNEDGMTLVEHYTAHGKDKVTVTDELIERAIELGFLAEGGQITIEVDAPENAVYTSTSTELQNHYQHWIESHQSIQIQIHDADDSLHEHDIVIDFDDYDEDDLDDDDYDETDDTDDFDDHDDGECDDYDDRDDRDDDDDWDDDDYDEDD